MGQIQGEAKPRVLPSLVPTLSQHTQHGRCSSDVLDVLPMHFQPFLLPQPQHVPRSGRCRILGSMARWAAPGLLPCQQFARGFSCSPWPAAKLPAPKEPNSQPQTLPITSVVQWTGKKKKKRIDLEERFYLFNKEAEEEGYLELP